MDWGSRLETQQQQLFCSPETGCSRTVYSRGFPAKDKQASAPFFQFSSRMLRALLMRGSEDMLYCSGTNMSEPFEDEHEQ